MQVVYFGDSMRSDMFPASSYGKWETVMIVEEMEGEGVPCTNQAKSSEGPPEPLEKKGKYEVSGFICFISLHFTLSLFRHSHSPLHKHTCTHPQTPPLSLFQSRVC